jgi:hypothetical protein
LTQVSPHKCSTTGESPQHYSATKQANTRTPASGSTAPPYVQFHISGRSNFNHQPLLGCVRQPNAAMLAVRQGPCPHWFNPGMPLQQPYPAVLVAVAVVVVVGRGQVLAYQGFTPSFRLGYSGSLVPG